LALGSAVLGPSFSVAVTNSLIITRLDEAPNQLTGLSWEYRPTSPPNKRPADQATWGAGGTTDYETIMAEAVSAVESVRPATHLPAQFQYETSPISVPGISTRLASRPSEFDRVDVKLLAKDGACERLRVTGACPTRAGDILMLAGDAKADGLQIGDTVRLGAPLGTLRLVGTYLPPVASHGDDADYWFDASRFQSLPVQVLDRIGVRLPRRPAPYVTMELTLARVPAESLLVRADSRLNVTPELRVGDFPALLNSVESVANSGAGDTTSQAPLPGSSASDRDGTLTEVSLNDLQGLTAGIAAERKIASSSVAPAVLSVILVALALLSRLLTAAADLRISEIALASLRGAGTRRTWTLALAEPLTLLAIAAPIGIALGVASSWLLVRLWLVPSLPLPLPSLSWVAAGLVIAIAALVVVLATGTTLRRTLAMMLAGIKRPGRGPRAIRVGTHALIALALIIPISTLTGGRTAPDATDLILPVLLGVAAGVIATRITWWLARAAQKRRRGSIAGYVAVRALARRREATLVIIPLAVAVAVSLFGSGIYGAAASWRASVAATEAPAAYVYDTDQSMTAAIDLTHDLDPDGRWLMAAGTFNTSKVPWTVVDAPRLARVATWSDQWTNHSLTDLARRLSAAPLPTIRGQEASLTITAPEVPSSDDQVPATVELVLRPFNDTIRQIYLKPFTASHTTVTAQIPCETGCHVLGMTIGGGAASPADLATTYVVGPLTVDSATRPEVFTDGGWGPAPVEGVGLQSAQTVQMVDDQLRVELKRTAGPELVRLTSGAIPNARPVLAGRDAVDILNDVPPGAQSAILLPPTAHAAAVAESIPFVGPRGVLADYTMTVQGHPLDEDDWDVHILANSDTPAQVQDDLAARGITLSTTNAAVTTQLDATAYALAIRLYAITAGLVLLMALAGLVITTAVQLPGRRSDAASMRVIGLRRRFVLAAIMRETGIVLGVAAIAGALAGLTSQLVVLRTLTLGSITDEITSPRLLAVLDPTQIALSATVAVVVLIAATITSAMLTVKGARGAVLRDNGR
jgi:hypothetical protein